MQGLVKARHRGHQGRARLNHVRRQGIGAFGVVDLGANGDGQELPRRMLVGMGQRQEGQEHLVLEFQVPQDVPGAGDVAEDRPVAEHHPLGRAAGARGVDQARGVGALHLGGAFVAFVHLAPSQLHHLVPAMKAGADRLADGRGFDRNHPRHLRRPRHRRQQPLRQRRRRHDRRPRAAVLDHVEMIVGRVGGVGRHRDAARTHDADIGDQPFGTVLRYQDHPVAGLEAKGAQTLGERAGPFGGLGPAQRPVAAILLGPQERTLAKPFGLVEKHRRQGRPAIGFHHRCRRFTRARNVLILPPRASYSFPGVFHPSFKTHIPPVDRRSNP